VSERSLLLTVIVLLGCGLAPAAPAFAQEAPNASAGKQEKPMPGGYVLEKDKDVARNEPGTHKGGGETIGYSFSARPRISSSSSESARSNPAPRLAITYSTRMRSITC